jgi:hypothetical protein
MERLCPSHSQPPCNPHWVVCLGLHPSSCALQNQATIAPPCSPGLLKATDFRDDERGDRRDWRIKSKLPGQLLGRIFFRFWFTIGQEGPYPINHMNTCFKLNKFLLFFGNSVV